MIPDRHNSSADVIFSWGSLYCHLFKGVQPKNSHPRVHLPERKGKKKINGRLTFSFSLNGSWSSPKVRGDPHSQHHTPWRQHNCILLPSWRYLHDRSCKGRPRNPELWRLQLWWGWFYVQHTELRWAWYTLLLCRSQLERTDALGVYQGLWHIHEDREPDHRERERFSILATYKSWQSFSE